MRIRILFILILVFILFNVNSVSAQQVCDLENCSIDAITVYEGVSYSFYGHNSTNDSHWWSLSGGTSGSLGPMGSYAYPDVDYKSKNLAISVWEYVIVDEAKTCTPTGGNPVPIDIYKGDIKFSIFNGGDYLPLTEQQFKKPKDEPEIRDEPNKKGLR